MTESVQSLSDNVRRHVQRVVVGQDRAIDQLLIALFAGGHALIEDVPGTGKTTLAKALADTLSVEFRRIQFTPDLVPTDVLGVNVYDPKTSTFRFVPGPIFGQVVLADEINRATPRTQAALLEAMQEGQVSIDGETRALPQPFLVVATLNPVELEGTFPLPEAQLDRFLLRIRLGYPTEDNALAMLKRFDRQLQAPTLSAVLDAAAVSEMRRQCDAVRVDEKVQRYLLRIVESTRVHQNVRLGASPRSALALQAAAKVQAALSGRDFLMPDDVKALAVPVLGHRLVLSADAHLSTVDGDTVVQEVLNAVEVPIQATDV